MNVLGYIQLGLGLVAFAGAGAGETPQPASVITRAQIEADWLLQAERRGQADQAGAITPAEDAAGGCDGVKDGKPVGYYGFHTNREKNAWWQVDLQAEVDVGKVVIYNASTPTDAKRALGGVNI